MSSKTVQLVKKNGKSIESNGYKNLTKSHILIEMRHISDKSTKKACFVRSNMSICKYKLSKKDISAKKVHN